MSALEKIHGSFSSGIAHATKILNVRGRVLPSSEGDMRLKITLKDGTILNGEKHLDDNERMRRIGIRDITLEKSVYAHKASVRAIEDADYVIIGPGDLFGSIIPNLLVGGIVRALKKTKAKIIFIAPLTNKKGHSDGFHVHDYVTILEKYIGKKRIAYVVVNTKRPPRNVLTQYEKKEGADSFVCMATAETQQGRYYKILTGDFLSRAKVQHSKGDRLAATRAFIRHDPGRIASAVAYLIEYGGANPFDIR